MQFYNYKATVTSVYDGDTIRCNIDLGFSVTLANQSIRLYGINTPEVRGEERDQGIVVRDFVRDLILGKEIILQTLKDKKGKYGRWLATVYFGPEQTCLNNLLLEKEFAKPYLK